MIYHLVSAGAGVAAAPCLAYLFLDGISRTVLFMIGGAIVMGLLASACWLSPVAAVIAGAPLLAVGLFMLLAPATAQGVIVHLV
jgi:hypothetical protein